MRILLDMNLSPKFVGMLKQRGIIAAHWSSIGAPDATDAEIMNYALCNGYAVLTYDLDFSTILSVTQGNKPSVVQLRACSRRLEDDAELIASALSHHENDLREGAILTIGSGKTRLRSLLLHT